MTHVFKHPKYYKELKASQEKKDQAISGADSTEKVERAPGPGPKPQASSTKRQAASIKRQAAQDS